MREKMSKQTPSEPTVRAIDPCPTIIQISRMPQHWKFTQHLRTIWPSPPGQSESKKEEEDRKYDGKTILMSGQGWALLAQLGQPKTEPGAKALLLSHLWCPDDLAHLWDRTEQNRLWICIKLRIVQRSCKVLPVSLETYGWILRPHLPVSGSTLQPEGGLSHWNLSDIQD